MSAPFSWDQSGLFATRVDDAHHFDRIGSDFVNQNIVWVNHCLARSGGSTGPICVGVIRELFSASFDPIQQPLGSSPVVVGDIIYDLPDVDPSSIVPYQPQRGCSALLAMIARISAIT